MENKFKRRDKVAFSGGEVTMYFEGQPYTKELLPTTTFIWAVINHEETKYVIQHTKGFPKKYFIASDIMPDGFESIKDSQLQDGYSYTFATEDQLALIDEAPEPKKPELEPQPETVRERKLLIINGTEYAKYEMDDKIIFINITKELIPGDTENSEKFTIAIISQVEERLFSAAAYLNIDAESATQE